MEWRNVLAACIWIVLGVGLMQGCSSKDKELYSKIHERSERFSSLQQSEKVIFHQGEDNETIVLITYLSGTDTENESFIIAGTPADKINTDALKKSQVSGKNPLKIEKIKRTDTPEYMRHNIPKWFTVYRVDYPKTAAKKLSLTLAIDGESRTTYFYKEPKYLINKKPYKSF